jgi:hypothetical protein
MGAEGLRRQSNFTNHINSRGTDTTVNGQTIKALWQDAQIARVQLFLNENQWGTASFEVRFPAAVLAAPYSLKNGMEVTRQGLSWRGVVREMTPEESDGVIIQVNALVILAVE